MTEQIVSRWWVCEQCHEQFQLNLPIGTRRAAYLLELIQAHALVRKSDCTNISAFHNDAMRDAGREHLDEFLAGLAP